MAGRERVLVEWGVRFPDTGTIYPCSLLVPPEQRRHVTAVFAAAADLVLVRFDGTSWNPVSLPSGGPAGSG